MILRKVVLSGKAGGLGEDRMGILVDYCWYGGTTRKNSKVR
ncbi:hypothetical protein [Bartonella sp. WD12.1]|nr:hypothetical protein [Bartonella sp. WD12.1]